MKNLLLIGACVSALAACAQTTQTTESSATTISTAGTPARGDQIINTLTYACEDGTRLTAAFNDTAKTVTVTLNGGAPMTLPEHETGDATFDYSDAAHSLRGKQQEATWTIGKKMPTKCKVV